MDDVSAGYPTVAGKHVHPSVYGPGDLFAAGGGSLGPMPQHVILGTSFLFASHLAAERRRYEPVAASPLPSAQLYLDRDHAGVGVVYSMGTPGVIAMLTEHLVHHGTRSVVTISTGDAIRDGFVSGDVCVVTDSIRDDGVSHHYLPPGLVATPSAPLTRDLVEATHAKTGRAWTLPTRYRVTEVELAHHAANNVVALDTETAALFATASCRDARSGACLVIAEDLRRPGTGVDWLAVRDSLLGLLDQVPVAMCMEAEVGER
jgi:Phosphorylase superfamily